MQMKKQSLTHSVGAHGGQCVCVCVCVCLCVFFCVWNKPKTRWCGQWRRPRWWIRQSWEWITAREKLSQWSTCCLWRRCSTVAGRVRLDQVQWWWWWWWCDVWWTSKQWTWTWNVHEWRWSSSEDPSVEGSLMTTIRQGQPCRYYYYYYYDGVAWPPFNWNTAPPRAGIVHVLPKVHLARPMDSRSYTRAHIPEQMRPYCAFNVNLWQDTFSLLLTVSFFLVLIYVYKLFYGLVC